MIISNLKTISRVVYFLLICSFLIIGIDYIYLEGEFPGDEPPEYIIYNDVKYQSVIIGRGQTLVLQGHSSYPLRITVANDHIFFNQILDRFDIRVNVSHYSIVEICWNNSVFTTENNQSLGTNFLFITRMKIEGVDHDVLITSLALFLCGVVLELSIRLFNNTHTFILKVMNTFNSIITKTHGTSNQSRFKFHKFLGTLSSKPIYLILKKEDTRSPPTIYYVLLIISFLIADPNNRPWLRDPSRIDLGVHLISSWHNSLESLWLIWIVILSLIGIMIWKSRLDTSEIRNDFSLPVSRRLFAIGFLLCAIYDCVLVTIIPLTTSVLINYFRFEVLADLSIVNIGLIWFIMCIMTLFLAGSAIGLLFFDSSLYSVIIYYLCVIVSLMFVNETFFSSLILPIPSGLNALLDHYVIPSVYTFSDIILSLLSSTLLILSIVCIYLYAIQQLEIT